MPPRSVPHLVCLVVGLAALGYSASAGRAQAATPARESPTPQPDPTLRINVDRILVPVTVRDSHGHPVPGLTRDDFQVYDNNKPRPLSGFSVQTRSLPATPSNITSSASVASPATDAPTPHSPIPEPASALPDRITVLLFDDLHLSESDLAASRDAALKVLPGVLNSGADLAAILAVSGKVNSGLTRDPAKLRAALAALRPLTLFHTSAGDCPSLNFYQADLIVNQHNYTALQDAAAQVLNCNPGINPQTDPDLPRRLAESTARRIAALGAQDAQTTLSNITEVVRRLAAMPGQRTVLLASGGFLPLESEARSLESRLIDLAIRSSVVINSLDARGLYTTSATASEEVHSLRSVGRSEYREQALKSAEESLGELADGTGGSFFHNSNDLDAGFTQLAAPPEVLYLLELPIDSLKPDNSWHRLKVTVTRPGCQLTARNGYFLPKPPKARK